MLLVIDVGNTNMTFGMFEKEELVGTFRLTTTVAKTSDEYGADIICIMGCQKKDASRIEDVIIASVVPQVMYSLTNAIRKYLRKEAVIVGIGTKTGIRISMSNPSDMGADRIADAVGGLDLYGGPVIVVDYGTATTYDLIGEDGAFIAGITSPGLKLCANALWNGTAKLPEIEIALPDSILAKNTITSMQAGLVYGTIGQTEYIIRQIQKESGFGNVKVIATGGLGRLIAEHTDSIDVYDPNLTLEGLRLIYEKSRKA